MPGAKPGHPDTGTHAPKGGVILKGQFFHGGEYIPTEVMEGLSDKQKERLQHHASPLDKWARHHANLRNYVNDKDAPESERDERKQKAIAAHRKMLMNYYHDLKERSGDPGDEVRKKLQKMHDYFRERIDRPESGRGSWDWKKAENHQKDLQRTEKRNAERAAGTLVEWPEGKLSPSHDDAIKKLRKDINASDAAIHKGFFKKEAITMLGLMSAGAAQKFIKNIGRAQMFYQGTSTVSHGEGKVAGYAYLGGGSVVVGVSQGTLAHEVAHTVDRQLSVLPEWNSAWKEEICRNDRPLSDYATTKPSEGFAEFGRLLWSHSRKDAKPPDMEQVAKTFPKCLAFWKKHVDGV